MNKITPIITAIMFFCGSLQAQLFINEIMASNTATITDDSGSYEDWIEIYNAGSADVNLSGYYFSDDPAEPLKWQIPLDNPTMTNVPAGGFLLLWADKDPEEGPTHLDFKLTSGGETIKITHPDGINVIEEVSFTNQAADISYGRISDGNPAFQLFSNPSPGASNLGGGAGLTFPVDLCTQVANNSEDAVENISGAVSVEGFGLRMGEDFIGPTTTGLRFTVDLPANAIIEKASIQFKAAGQDTNPANWNIKAELISNAPAFTTTNGDVSSRTTTNTSISWSPEAWSIDGTEGIQLDTTPNIAPLIQEVLDLGGWNENNSIVIIITGTGMRNAFNGSTGNNFGPILCIETAIPYPSDPIENIFINEIAAAGTAYEDETGTHEDWIELYNANNFAIDISGLYLTDDYTDLDLFRIPTNTIIPANGFVTFFADKDEEEGPLHTNFNLRSKGEEVALAMQLNSGLVILDSISYDDAPFMSSFGRSSDGAADWILFGQPTPNDNNAEGLLYLVPPTYSLACGIYQESTSTEITHPVSDVSIYYTTNGTLPDQTSNLYSGVVSILGTQNLRAIAYKNGYAPSVVETSAYVIEDLPNIPILYLTTDPANFFDNEIGIYVDGTNGIQAFCAPYPVNWAQDWERPVNLKLFLPDGTNAFNVEAGAKISGVCSRNNAMKSLAISLREKDYGNGELGYNLFDNRDHDNYLRFKVRNSGQDFVRMGFRDMINQSLVIDKIDIDYQSGRPVLLYLNGQFWGIHNIREKYTGEYFEDNYDVDKNKIDIIKSPGLPWMEVKQGTPDSFMMVYNFVDANTLVDDNNFDFFESHIDVNEFLNYWITMMYMANYDWPANNLTVWRQQKAGKKWRYCLADTDGSTNNFLSTLSTPDFNTLDMIMDDTSMVWPNHQNSTLLLRKLVQRDDYQAEFAQRTCSFIGLLFNTERVFAQTDSIKALFEPNVDRHLIKWGDSLALGGTVDTWNQWVQAYKDFYAERPANMYQQFQDQFDLEETYELTFVFDEETPGYVVVNRNEMEVPFNFTNPYFRNLPLRVRAVEKPGSVFSHWLETGVTNPIIDYVGTGDATLTPIFSCANGTPGSACDDGDDCTIDDTIDEDCVCRGTIPDNNMDGVIDELDCLLDAVDDLEDLRSTLKLFPNPTADNLTIEFEALKINQIDVFSTSGALLFSKYNLNTNLHTISARTLPAGIYFLRIHTENGQFYFANFSVTK